MRVIAKRTLREFWKKYPDAESPLEAWHAEAKAATWTNPVQVRARFPSADVVGDNRMVFNIGGNKYRLVVRFNYDYQIAYVKFVGTHAEYDKIDVETVR
jgi:mRNA interferase HigB